MVDDEHEIVEKMIEVLYTATFRNNESTNDVTLVQAVKLYIMGDKYDIPSLKQCARDVFKSSMQKPWGTQAFLVALELIYKGIPDTDTSLKFIAFDHLFGRRQFDEVLASPALAKLDNEVTHVGLEIAQGYRRFIKQEDQQWG